MFEKKYRANVLASCSGEGLKGLEIGTKELVEEEVVLSGFNIAAFSVFGIVKIGERRKLGWKQDLPFFLVKGGCGHIFLDYPHGHFDRFDCPVCNL